MVYVGSMRLRCIDIDQLATTCILGGLRTAQARRSSG